MRRRYSHLTARLTVTGDTPKGLATHLWLTPLATISMAAASCSPDNRRGAPSFLPSAFTFSKPALVRRRSRPEYSQEQLRRVGIGILVLGPGLFVVGQAANPHPAPLQVVDVAHDVQPAPPDAIDGYHNQGAALGKPGVQRVPASPVVGTGNSGDADILIYVRKHHAGGQQLLALGFWVAARQLGDSGAAGADVPAGLGHRSSSNWWVLRYTFVTHSWTS